MYTGKHASALQSQKWIGESLIDLMAEKSYHMVTIGEICTRADLSRQTFYNVFKNKEEVLRFLLRTDYEKKFSAMAEEDSISTDAIVQAFVQVVAEEETLLKWMIRDGLEGILVEEIANCVSLFAERFVSPPRRDELLPYSKVMLCGALGYVLVFWFKQKQPLSMERLSKLIGDFLNGEVYELRA